MAEVSLLDSRMGRRATDFRLPDGRVLTQQLLFFAADEAPLLIMFEITIKREAPSILIIITSFTTYLTHNLQNRKT